MPKGRVGDILTPCKRNSVYAVEGPCLTGKNWSNSGGPLVHRKVLVTQCRTSAYKTYQSHYLELPRCTKCENWVMLFINDLVYSTLLAGLTRLGLLFGCLPNLYPFIPFAISANLPILTQKLCVPASQENKEVIFTVMVWKALRTYCRCSGKILITVILKQRQFHRRTSILVFFFF